MRQQKVVSLTALPESGLQFDFDQKTAELNESVRDLLGTEPYSFSFDLRPLGNVYELRGKMHLHMPMQCAKCGEDFKEDIQKPVHELFVIEDPRHRTDQSRKSGQSFDPLQSGPFCNHLYSDRFDIGEFFHELVAASEPSLPVCRQDCSPDYEKFNKNIDLKTLAGPSSPGRNPFEALKDFKLKK